jgi:predicted site-specific integrase-resolvase
MYTISEFAKLIGLSPATLRNWDKQGKLKPIVLESGHRRYTDEHYMHFKGIANESRINVLYIRESTKSQEHSLTNQEERSKLFMESAGITLDEIISDFGSGLNYHRSGFKKLLTMLLNKRVAKLVIHHKDRLMRFGFEMIEQICHDTDTELIVIDKTETPKSHEEELAEDLISIIHHFSMKLYGSRSYKKKLKEKLDENV